MVRSPRRAQRTRSERGASAVEFAILLPVLITIIGAIIDFGFIFSQQITMNNSARDAARAGVVTTLSGSTMSCSQIAAQARDAMTSGAVGISNANKIRVGVVVTGQAGSCTLAANSASVSSNGTITPCTGSSGAAVGTLKNLQVTVSYSSTPPFPVPFMGTPVLSARGDFQCEYT
ncbi:TadE/TadG family type IV pilus assembly protein [Oryzobacter telluris]|uniref:TadE/TadG family type IV pilus assembly protein n=1 Tax=Oryzobacter telluris TaxID=3149179 RepID=UPI00370D6DB2